MTPTYCYTIFRRNVQIAPVSLLTKPTVAALQGLQNDNKFNELWKEKEKLALEEEYAMAVIPEKRKCLERLVVVTRMETVNQPDFYRQNVYFLVLDTLINNISYRFQENNLKVFHSPHFSVKVRSRKLM